METFRACPGCNLFPQFHDLMHAYKIAQLISRSQAKPADLPLGPLTGIPKGFDFFDRPIEADLSGLEFNIQLGPQISPELTLQSDFLPSRILDISQFIQELLPITGPTFVKEGRFDLASNRVGMMDTEIVQQMMSGIGLMG